MRAILGGVALGLLGLLAAGIRSPSRPLIAVFHGGGLTAPAIVVERPGSVPPVVLNCGDWETGRQIAAWLRERGHERVSLLAFTRGRRDHVGGGSQVLNGLTVEALALPPTGRRPPAGLLVAAAVSPPRVRRFERLGEEKGAAQGLGIDRLLLRLTTAAGHDCLQLNDLGVATGGTMTMTIQVDPWRGATLGLLRPRVPPAAESDHSRLILPLALEPELILLDRETQAVVGRRSASDWPGKKEEVPAGK